MGRTKTNPLQFIVLSALCLAANAASADGTSFAAEPRAETTRKFAKWMSRLPDDALLSKLSLPGTHNTCALHNGFSLGFAKCQTWSLADQLRAGVRFLDIRCRHLDDQLLIYHGVVDQKTTFRSVRDVCREFLKAHPTECIVMAVKEESTAKNNSQAFAATFAEAIRHDGDLWHISRKAPALAPVRRRIVLIDRVGTLGGLPWQSMKRQDQYQAPVELKMKLVRSHFEQTANGREDQWFINYCSGVVPGSLMTPRKYAVQTNRAALEYLQRPNRSEPLRLGTVVMDFPGDELIERIVQSNFPRDRGE